MSRLPENDPFYTETGRRLKSLREKAGLSLTAMEAKMGVTHQVLSDYERGRLRVPLHRAMLWCRMCGTKVDVFMASLDAYQKAHPTDPVTPRT